MSEYEERERRRKELVARIQESASETVDEIRAAKTPAEIQQAKVDLADAFRGWWDDGRYEGRHYD